MSNTLVIPTAALLSLLDRLGATSGGEHEGLLLYTTRGEYGAEPGQVGLLAGMSTTGAVFSGYYVPVADGTLTPCVWPLSAAGVIARAYAGLAKASKDEDHMLRVVQRSGADGDQIEVAALHEPTEGVRLVFPVKSVDEFPVAAVQAALEGHPSVTTRQATDKTVISTDSEIQGDVELWNPAAFGVLLKLAKKYKTNFLLSQTRGGLARVTLEGDDTWTGAILAASPTTASVIHDGIAVTTYLDVPLPSSKVDLINQIAATDAELIAAGA